MQTYYIPRNLKGETRILNIFSTKSLLYTAIGIGVGLPFFFIAKAISGRPLISAIFPIVTALLGYAIGAFKFPSIRGAKWLRNLGGENIDDIIIRFFRFYFDFNLLNMKKKKKIYIYTKEEDLKWHKSKLIHLFL